MSLNVAVFKPPKFHWISILLKIHPKFFFFLLDFGDRSGRAIFIAFRPILPQSWVLDGPLRSRHSLYQIPFFTSFHDDSKDWGKMEGTASSDRGGLRGSEARLLFLCSSVRWLGAVQEVWEWRLARFPLKKIVDHKIATYDMGYESNQSATVYIHSMVVSDESHS
jgi:hypothetical protein